MTGDKRKVKGNFKIRLCGNIIQIKRQSRALILDDLVTLKAKAIGLAITTLNRQDRYKKQRNYRF